MKISVVQTLVLIAFISVLFAITFSTPPILGWMCWSWINVGIFPPFIVVSAIFSQGQRRAFFIGCMIAGSLHYLANSWYFVYAGMAFGMAEFDNLDLSNPGDLLVGGWGPHLDTRIIQLLFTFASFVGGLIGLQAYRMAEASKLNP